MKTLTKYQSDSFYGVNPHIYDGQLNDVGLTCELCAGTLDERYLEMLQEDDMIHDQEDYHQRMVILESDDISELVDICPELRGRPYSYLTFYDEEDVRHWEIIPDVVLSGRVQELYLVHYVSTRHIQRESEWGTPGGLWALVKYIIDHRALEAEREDEAESEESWLY